MSRCWFALDNHEYRAVEASKHLYEAVRAVRLYGQEWLQHLKLDTRLRDDKEHRIYTIELALARWAGDFGVDWLAGWEKLEEADGQEVTS